MSPPSHPKSGWHLAQAGNQLVLFTLTEYTAIDRARDEGRTFIQGDDNVEPRKC